MSLKTGIFNSTSVETTETGLVRGNKAVDAAFLAKLLSSLVTTGVLAQSGSGFLSRAAGGVTGESNAMQVITGPGACMIEGYFAYDTASETRTFSVSANDRTTARLFRLNTADGTIQPMWKECTRSGNVLITKSENQRLPVRSGDIFDLVTAVVDIPAGTTAITDAMVTDLRADEAMCGFARSAFA